MIEILSVSKDYGKKLAVNNLNLKINDGEVFGLIGSNGAGKSTTIKMITGIITPTKGDVIIQGQSILNNSFEAKKHFAYVADTPDMFLGMTGIEYLTFIGSIFHINENEFSKRVNELSEEFSMKNSLNDVILNPNETIACKLVDEDEIKEDSSILHYSRIVTALQNIDSTLE